MRVETKSQSSTSSDCSPSEKLANDWTNLYAQSQACLNFKLRPKTPNMDFFEYDVFVFHADLTELNTDGLVNATNANLHPGYDGDGIARRIREKAGKQLVDACKRILKQDRNSLNLNDSECVLTKAYGKLKAKYVLHTCCPTWAKYVANGNETNNLESKFETVLEQTFANVIKLAHDPKLSLNSIAFAMASNSLGW